jgi:hypothetical protein
MIQYDIGLSEQTFRLGKQPLRNLIHKAIHMIPLRKWTRACPVATLTVENEPFSRQDSPLNRGKRAFVHISPRNRKKKTEC